MLSELIQCTLISNALVRLHQGTLNASPLMFPGQWLLLEPTCKDNRFLFLFLTLVRCREIHHLKRALIDHFLGNLLTTNGRGVLKITAGGNLDLFFAMHGWCDLIGRLPLTCLHRAHLCVPEVISVVIGLCEIGRGCETLRTGLFGPPEHLRSIHSLQDNRSFLIIICSYFPNNCSLLF